MVSYKFASLIQAIFIVIAGISMFDEGYTESEIINEPIAREIEELGLDSIRVRSSLTCESRVGICAKCYGVDLSTGRLVEQGDLTLDELCLELNREHEVLVHRSAVGRWLHRLVRRED